MASFTAFFVLFVISTLGFRSAPSVGARDFPQEAGLPAIEVVFINNVTGTPAGDRFDREIGADYVKATLLNATAFTWKLFEQTTFSETREYEMITCVLADNPGGVGVTGGNMTAISAQWVETYEPTPELDLKLDFTGLLYHENAHIWQFLGENANRGLAEGIADFVRLRGGFAGSDWTIGFGDKWDEGYAVTARFLEYLDDNKPGFVAALNKKMAGTFSEAFFVELLGKPVEQLWREYKDKYGGQDI